ncbi:putative hydro-lyase [Streptomyces xiaopingdaonensis]|uniref:putative hydro-lyase n=1 Tax=Streptomyces xiaopingdaonensis TaxID=1565415 RepID=UPI00030C8E01|nr:putative hydro-lyase [Streptomyces xiaopingdaonensis]
MDSKTQRSLTPGEARQKIRDGHTDTTSGWSDGWAQANLLAVPREQAFDLMLFSQRNPKACPLLDVFDPGATRSSRFQGDITTDVPAYRVYEHGELVEERTDVADLWRDDLVAFLFGCSFSFERALTEAGIEMRHTLSGSTVPMYRTTLPCESAGVFSSSMVVSMRGVPPHRVPDAVRICARYPAVHGAPVHIGDPSLIGVTDLEKPDWGDSPVMRDGDVPVFWACGVTPQAMVIESRPEFAIAHAPGRMAITDINESELITP